MNWSKAEINSIKVGLSTGRRKLAERLSNRIGMDKKSVRSKIEEVKLKQKIGRLARNAKEEVKKHRGRRFKKGASEIKKFLTD